MTQLGSGMHLLGIRSVPSLLLLLQVENVILQKRLKTEEGPGRNPDKCNIANTENVVLQKRPKKVFLRGNPDRDVDNSAETAGANLTCIASTCIECTLLFNFMEGSSLNNLCYFPRQSKLTVYLSQMPCLLCFV